MEPLAFILTLAAGAGVASVGWWAYLRRAYAEPVRELRQAMKRGRRGGVGEAAGTEPTGAEPIRKAGHRLNQLLARLDAELAEAARRDATLTALVDALPDPILLADEHDTIQLVNRPAAELLGVEPAAATGRPAAQVLVDRPLLKLFDRTVRKKRGDRRSSETTRRREITLARDGRSVTFDALARLTAAGGALVVLRDVSTEAGAAQMKSDFVANASHELRTPVAAMRLAVETLHHALADADHEQAGRCGTIIDNHLRRLGDLVADLLDLGRIESAQFRPDLQPLRVADALAPHASHTPTLDDLAREKGVTLTWPDEQASPAMLADARLLYMVLKNLVENAIKFTPAGGSVDVTAERVDDHVRVMVSDTGIGIPAEAQARVFERFFQADAARTTAATRGTGLGLSIVKHSAQAMDGTVQLTSREGEGTKISVTLPAA